MARLPDARSPPTTSHPQHGTGAGGAVPVSSPGTSSGQTAARRVLDSAGQWLPDQYGRLAEVNGIEFNGAYLTDSPKSGALMTMPLPTYMATWWTGL